MNRKLLLIFCLFFFVADGAEGQSLFKRSALVPEYESYRYIDECMAAVERRDLEVRFRSLVWEDTLEFNRSFVKRPIVPEAKAIAVRCLSSFKIDTVPLKNPGEWVSPLLLVDRGAEAEKWFTRLLDSFPTPERWAQYAEIITSIASVRPVQTDMAERVYNRALGDIPYDSIEALIKVHMAMVEAVYYSDDSSLETQVFKDIISLIDRIPDSVKEEQGYTFQFAPLLLILMHKGTEAEAMDSFKTSMDAYVRYRSSVWKRVMNTSFDESGDAVGLSAPVVEGDFWFQSLQVKANSGGIASKQSEYTKISRVESPQTGKVNLIAFLQGGCHFDTPKVLHGRSNGDVSCWSTISMLRRLHAKYPNIQLTVVTKTHGSIGNAPPLSESEEADTLAKYFLGFHRLPATYAVSSGPFVRMSIPDSRRVDTETVNEINYYFRGQSLIKSGTVVLTDVNGRIVYATIPQVEDEMLLKRLIEIELKR